MAVVSLEEKDFYQWMGDQSMQSGFCTVSNPVAEEVVIAQHSDDWTDSTTMTYLSQLRLQIQYDLAHMKQVETVMVADQHTNDFVAVVDAIDVATESDIAVLD